MAFTSQFLASGLQKGYSAFSRSLDAAYSPTRLTTRKSACGKFLTLQGSIKVDIFHDDPIGMPEAGLASYWRRLNRLQLLRARFWQDLKRRL
jgi:hypothetical protein